MRGKMKFQRFNSFISNLIISLFLFNGLAVGQPKSTTDLKTEDLRLTRLVGLAKVWGTVRYFHPYLASREIDWDKALIETIPRVKTAKSSQEYQAAINSMLSVLGDKNTLANIVNEKPKAENETTVRETAEPVRLENDVLMIDAVAVGKAIVAANNRLPEFLTKTTQNLKTAKAILIDLRSGGDLDGETTFYLDFYLQGALAAIVDRNVPQASLRYRLHNGYPPQVGSTSGGYYSGLVTENPQIIAGTGQIKPPPMIFLVNEGNFSAESLSGLQAAKLAFVVQDGETAMESGIMAQTINLPDNIEVKIRIGEIVNADGTVGFIPDAVSSKGEAEKLARQILAENKFVSNRPKSAPTVISQISQKDKNYPEMEFPNAEYRLLALFRFWHVINLFFPYKHLIDEPWENILPRYITRFEANQDAADYQLTVREMVAEIQDSHGGVRGANKAADRLGRFLPSLSLKFIENQTVVQYVSDSVKDVKVGDVITAVEGVPIEKLRENYARYFSASTPQALMRNVHFDLLRGPENSRKKLTLRGLDGATREAEVVALIAPNDPLWAKINNREKPLPVFTVLPSGYGYIDLSRLTVGEVDKMFETIKATPAAIFDMRGYPNGTAWEIAPRLTEKQNVAAASFSRPLWSAKDLISSDFANGSNYTFMQTLPARKGDVYKGKMVMLIDENAQSQSEHTALFFEAATDLTLIGTPTAGANGDVTRMVLPGNLTVSFSGHDVRHADGRQLQRLGIQPHIKVAPTIRGLFVENRDEVLEAAIKFLQSSVKK
jgi:C-terminal processing protease CtpA/Prc